MKEKSGSEEQTVSPAEDSALEQVLLQHANLAPPRAPGSQLQAGSSMSLSAAPAPPAAPVAKQPGQGQVAVLGCQPRTAASSLPSGKLSEPNDPTDATEVHDQSPLAAEWNTAQAEGHDASTEQRAEARGPECRGPGLADSRQTAATVEPEREGSAASQPAEGKVQVGAQQHSGCQQQAARGAPAAVMAQDLACSELVAAADEASVFWARIKGYPFWPVSCFVTCGKACCCACPLGYTQGTPGQRLNLCKSKTADHAHAVPGTARCSRRFVTCSAAIAHGHCMGSCLIHIRMCHCGSAESDMQDHLWCSISLQG